MCTQSDRNQADGVLTPMPWLITGQIVDADMWFRDLGAIAGSHGEGGSCYAVTKVNTIRPLGTVKHTGKIFSQTSVHRRRLRRVKSNQGVTRSLCNCGYGRDR